VARFVSILLLGLFSILPAVLAQPAKSLHRPAQQAHAPEIASYSMDVRLDPERKVVDGQARMSYRNPSTDVLTEVWLHLYLRAFRDPSTIWLQESGGEHRGFGFDPERRGDINISKLTLADGTDVLASATLTDTLMRVSLPEPLAPGQLLELDVAWTSMLPLVFARTGYGGRDDTFFMVGQWYPKFAVYENGRWNSEPWHANAEFFHDFGHYDVRITVPQEYVVAGAGVPVGEPTPGDGRTTARFTATGVTDFAFAASPDFLTQTAKAGNVDVVLYYLPEHAAFVPEYLEATTGSLEAFSAWFGPYPHPRLTVVDVPDNASGAGGMEYPTLITGGTLGVAGGVGFVSLVASHEVAHQWWPMQTATNEAREPWLDEGLTEYSGMRYMAEAGHTIGFGPFTVSSYMFDRGQYAAAPNHDALRPAWEYDDAAYGATVYSKVGLGLWTLENIVGTEPFRRAMAEYLAAYKYKHPTGADFRASLERSLDADLSWFFDDYLASTGVIDYAAAPIENSSTSSNVVVLREGAVPAPVEILITRASGTEELKAWDGQTERVDYTFSADDPVIRVEVDPQQHLRAELDVLDNATSTRVQVEPALTLGGRLVYWFQMFGQLTGFFG